MLVDKLTGESREVDILIEAEAAGFQFRIGIECVARKRRATVEWVEQMWAKHQTLLTNKLVLVSQAGFTADALAKAALRNIDALDLNRALTTDWNSIIAQLAELRIIAIDSQVVWCKAVLPQKPSEATAAVAFATLRLPSGESLGTIQELIRSFQQSNDIKKLIRSLTQESNGAAEVSNVVEFPTGTTFTALDGVQIEILRIRFGLLVSWRTSPVPFQTGSYAGLHIAHGSETKVLGPSRIALVQQPGQPLTIVVGLLDENGAIKSVQQFRGESLVEELTLNSPPASAGNENRVTPPDE